MYRYILNLSLPPVDTTSAITLLFYDETFGTESQNYGGKSPRIFGRISLPSTTGRWCHMALLDHATPVGG